jgi:Domain of unknown function (DUF4440)
MKIAKNADPVLILLACTLLSVSVAAAGDPSLKQALEARYAAMKTAMADRDAKAIGVLLAPDFESEDADGHVSTAAEMISQVTSMAKDPNKVSTTSLLSVSQVGDTAEVKQRYQMTTTRLQAGADKPNEVLLVTLSDDTWVRVSGAWLMKRTLTQSLDLSINGSPVAHKEHRP